VRKLKHKLKLLWLRRKWVIMCVYNNQDFRKARAVLEIEKEWTDEYHRAKREDNKLKIAKTEGGLKVIEEIKEALG